MRFLSLQTFGPLQKKFIFHKLGRILTCPLAGHTVHIVGSSAIYYDPNRQPKNMNFYFQKIGKDPNLLISTPWEKKMKLVSDSSQSFSIMFYINALITLDVTLRVGGPTFSCAIKQKKQKSGPTLFAATHSYILKICNTLLGSHTFWCTFCYMIVPFLVKYELWLRTAVNTVTNKWSKYLLHELCSNADLANKWTKSINDTRFRAKIVSEFTWLI